MPQLTTAEAARMLGIAEATLKRMAHPWPRTSLLRWAGLSGIRTMKFRGISVNGERIIQTSHRERSPGEEREWEYRFKLNGKPYSRVTDLRAVPENILKAHTERAAHIEELKEGKPFIRHVITPLDHEVPKFVSWYRSEHQNRKCKWAASLMASFQFYFEQLKCPLTRIGPAQLEDFKRGDVKTTSMTTHCASNSYCSVSFFGTLASKAG